MAAPATGFPPVRPAAALLLLAAALAALPPVAAAQTYRERQQAYERCHRDAARRFGPPPRREPRPGDDLVELARRQRDYEDSYSRFVGNCLADAEQRLRNKPAP
jgi:hypothetical protein